LPHGSRRNDPVPSGFALIGLPYRKKEDAIHYASQRFGGSRGEVHVYDATGKTIERKIIIDGRGQYQKARE
jgi:hypothetical protein